MNYVMCVNTTESTLSPNSRPDGKPPLSLFKQLAAKLRADGIYVIEFAFPAVRSIENINVLTIPFRIW